MRYAIANLGQAEPERYVPAGPADCSNAGEFRKAVENAQVRIAYYQALMQQGAQAGNDQAVDRASTGADLANRDWSAWSKVLRNCETPAAAAPGAAPAADRNYATIAIGVLGVGLVTALFFSKTKFLRDVLKGK